MKHRLPTFIFTLAAAFALSTECAANDGFDWTGEDGAVTVPDGTTAIVSNCDLVAIASLTNITCEGTTSRILFHNTEPFTLNAEITGPGGKEGDPAVIEMTADTGKITFAKTVYFKEGRKIVLGNADILGLFGANRSNVYGSINALAGCTVDFKEGSQLQREYINRLYGSGTFKFACKIPTTASAEYISLENATVVFNADNLFNAKYVSTSSAATFDLNGHSQSVGHIAGGTPVVTVKSAEPATLTLNGTTASSLNLALKGAASLVYANTAKMTVSAGESLTTGSLDVNSGTVELKGTASFKSGTINVTGGTLQLSTASATGAGVDIVVTGTGVLNVQSVTCTMRSLTILGNPIDLSEEVSIASLAALYPDNVAGSGFVRAPFVRYISPTGDDAADGKTEATAFKTLSKAVAVSCNPGDTVVALPGVYQDDVMTGASGEGYSRVVVPAGVTLKSRDGAASTTILGKKATSPVSGYEQSGTDSARCVTLKTGARLRGFTLTGGYATTDGTTHCNSSGVLAAGDDCYIVDCVITNCYSPSNFTCHNGKYLRCVVQNCRTKLTYACGVRDAYAYGSVFMGFTNNGYMDTAKAVVNCTFYSGTFAALRGTTASAEVRNSIFVSSVDPSGNAVTYRNCVFTRTPTVGTLKDCVVTNSDAIALNTDAWTIGAESVARGIADSSAYRDALLTAGFTDDEIDRDADVNGVPRVMAGVLDAGASQYDRRGEFSLALAIDGQTAVSWADPDVAPAERGLCIPDGQCVELDWSMPPLESTTFQFAAELADGASLAVYTNGALLATVVESGKVNFTGREGVSLRLVATGLVTVGDFRNAAKADIGATLGGIAVEGASVGVNYVDGAPLTFTVRRVYDSYDQYSTGFLSNGVAYAWADFPDGFTCTVSDLDSSVVFTAVYTEPGSLTEWYVDPVKGRDAANFGRTADNPFKTLKAAAERATSGHTIHAAAGTYAEGVMGSTSTSTSGTKGLCRVVVPEGVALVADDGAENTFIVGAKAEPAEARLALDGCGTNSVRGAYLKNNASLRGFTVTGGYGMCYVNGKGETDGVYGGGILCVDNQGGANLSTVGRVFDCVITNNYAWGGAGAHCGAYVRCKFLYNRSQLGYRVGLTGVPGCAINCYFRGQSSPQTVQGHVTDINWAVNCTFDGTIPGVRTAGYDTICYNCIFKANPSMSFVGNSYGFWNCRAAQLPTAEKANTAWGLDGCGNEVVAAEELELDPETCAPAAKGLSTVDSAAAWDIYADNVASVISEAEYALDLNGRARVLNGALDIGAAEYDWLGDYCNDLGSRRWLNVAAASANVVETDAKAVRLAGGSSVTLVFTIQNVNGDPFVSIPFAQSGSGVVTAVLDGEPLVPTGGVFVITATAAKRTLVLSYEGDGYVDLAKMRRMAGLLVIYK